MTAVDRNFMLGQLYDARRMQESRAQLPAEKTTSHKRLQAEARSYTLSLLIDAVNAGLLEQLHDEAQQALYIDVAVDQDRAWAAYRAGLASAPDTELLAVPDADDVAETPSLLSTTPLAIAFGAALPPVDMPESYVDALDDGTPVKFTVNGPGDYIAEAIAEHDPRTCPECVEQHEDEFVPEGYVGPTGIGSSTPGGTL